jgi:glucose/arabinose dehydrogenase
MRTKTNYAVLVVLAAILLFTACSGSTQTAAPSGGGTGGDAAPTPGGEMPLLQEPTVAYVVEPYALGIVFPTRMAWAPDGRLFVTEKSGAVRVISAKGELQADPVIELPTNQEGEQGLLGIAIDPNYEENHYIWVYHTWSDPEGEYDRPMHRVVRFEERNGKGKNPEVAWMMEDAFPESTILNGGEIGFGPDGMLYVSPGSSNNILSTNDPESPQGKMHRMTPTVPAEPAPDNPIPDSTIWAYGLRNSYAFTFHPVTGEMYSTENGPDCDDEINRILPGKHYGWRIDGLCEDTALPPEYPEVYEPPIVAFTPTTSPTGIMFYTGDVFEKWENNMFWCAYNLGRMYYIKLEEDGVGIVGAGTVETAPARCAVAITTGPDGYIYFSDLHGIFRVLPPGDANLD